MRAMIRARSGRALALAVGVLALTAACGDDDTGPSVASATSTEDPAPTTTEDGTAPPSTEPAPATLADALPGDPERVPIEGFDEVAVRIRPGGSSTWQAWCLLAAFESAQRSRGLMGVTDLQGYDGMVFGYEEDVENAFWMRNTPTPLSIAWISADGEIVSTADMEPCPDDQATCPTYPPGGRYRYAIEVFQGGLPALGITEGATVEVGGGCAPRA